MTACSGLAALPKTDCAAVHASLSMSRTSGAELATEVRACTAFWSSMALNGSVSFMGNPAVAGRVVERESCHGGVPAQHERED